MDELQQKTSEYRRGCPPRIECRVTEKICQCFSVCCREGCGQLVGEKYCQCRLPRARVAMKPQDLVCVTLGAVISSRTKPGSQMLRAKYPLAGASHAVTFLAFLYRVICCSGRLDDRDCGCNDAEGIYLHVTARGGPGRSVLERFLLFGTLFVGCRTTHSHSAAVL